MNRHAPIKRNKTAKPPLQCIRDLDIQQQKSSCHKSRYKSCQTNSDHDRQTSNCQIEKQLKSTIKEIKKGNFHKKALSSKRPTEVWKTVNKLLKMQKIPYELVTSMKLISTLISCFRFS